MGRSLIVCVLLLGSALLPRALPVTTALHAQSASWSIARAIDIRVACPLTVGGSFEAKSSSALTGSYRFSPEGTAAGDGVLAFDLRTLKTGIALRDTHLRENYLEVDKSDDFAQATLSRIQLTWQERNGVAGRGTFTGLLRLHGVERPVSGRMELRRNGAALRVRATFPVRLPDHAIAKPRYLGVGVQDHVDVQVSFEAVEEDGR